MGPQEETAYWIPQWKEMLGNAWAKAMNVAREAGAVFQAEAWERQRVLADTRLKVFDEALWTACEGIGDRQPENWECLRESLKAAVPEVSRLVVEAFVEVVRTRSGCGWEAKFSIDIENGIPDPEWMGSSLLQADFNPEGIGKVLREVWMTYGWRDEAERMAEVVSPDLLETVSLDGPSNHESEKQIHVYRRLFFRNQHAYLVGSVWDASGDRIPMALAFTRISGRTILDGLPFGEPALMRLFEFTRSYFFVAEPDLESLSLWLAGLIPRKDFAQLVVNLGFPDAGRQLIRAAVERVRETGGICFTAAPGVRGMVMIVFTAPNLNLVFKVIRTRIRPPKQTHPGKVLERYEFVARQDRVGRVADAQLHHNWRIPVECFDPALLEELRTEAAESVEIGDGVIVLQRVFTERKLVPLDLYLKTCDSKEADRAVDEYANAIRDLARTNFFPGDLLIKNFGLTPEGRVIFYDYDEVCRVVDCTFRKIPEPRDDEEAWDAEVWAPVRDEDIFPEEMPVFLLPSGRLRDRLLEKHRDLFTPDFWNHWKAFHQSGGLIDLPPFDPIR